MLVDTHCHLDMVEDPQGAMERMRGAGVAVAVTIGVDEASNEWAASFAAVHTEVFATVGLHPHDAKDRTDALMSRLEQLVGLPHVVGVGEAGLDYHYDNSPRDRQREVFAEQIRLAARAQKTLVIHSRDAWEDTFSILNEQSMPPRVVFHCFSGGPGEAERALGIGAVLSYSGVVTFPNAGELRDAARLTPLDRMVVETDAPFLTPVPHRGKRNEPGFVVHTARALAGLKGVDPEEFARQTTATARSLFDLPT